MLSTLVGWGFYVAVFISFTLSSLMLTTFLRGIGNDTIFISSYPLFLPLLSTVVIVSFYLVILSAVSVTREREHGTLEVLFYGRVSPITFVLGKYVADVLVYVLILALTGLYLTAVSAITNLGLNPALLKTFLLTIFLSSCMVSFGLMAATLTGKIRTCIVVLVAVLPASFIVSFLHQSAAAQVLPWLATAEEIPLVALLIRVVDWVCPFGYIFRGMNAIQMEVTAPYIANILYSILYTVVLLITAVLFLRWRGVRD
jgi:ABC-type transport system involved in multi-copper enzyme maturation permease subunit